MANLNNRQSKLIDDELRVEFDETELNEMLDLINTCKNQAIEYEVVVVK